MTSSPPTPIRTSALRLLRWLALAILAYLALGNLFLNTPLGEWTVNRKPEKFHMHWAHGLTLWPGQVMLWDVRLGGHVQRIDWDAHAHRAHGRIHLLPLLWKELRIDGIRASQVHGALRRAESRMPSPDYHPGGWTLRLPDIRTDGLGPVQLGELLVEGEGAARFGFVKQLRGGAMEILPSRFVLEDAQLSQGGQAFARDARLVLDLAMAPHRRDQAAGLVKLAMTDAELILQGGTASFVPTVDEDGRWHVAPGAPDRAGGQVSAHLRMVRGELQPGGRLDASIPLSPTDATGLSWDTLAQLEVSVEQDTRIALALPPSGAHGDHIEATFRLATRRLPEGGGLRALLPLVDGGARLQWHMGSLRWLRPLLPSGGWLDLQGTGTVEAELAVEAGHLAPGSRVRLPRSDLRATVLDTVIHGRAHGQARVDANGDTPRVTLDLVVDAFEAHAQDTPDTLFIRGRDLRLDLVGDGELASLHEALKARLRFAGAEAPDLRAYNPWLPERSLHFEGGSGLLDGDLHLDAEGEVGTGELRVRARGADVHLGQAHLRTDLDLQLRLVRGDLEARHFVLDGSRLRLDRLSLPESDQARHRDWWGEARFEQARLRWGRPLQAEGRVQARLRNVAVVLALFAPEATFPRWILRLVDAGEADIAARLALRPGGVLADHIDASNDRFDLLGRLRVAERKASGDLYVRWGVLGMGVELREGERQLHMRGARDWFEAQPAWLEP